MVLKLHGSPYSTCTQRVLIVFNEKNVPYELVPVDMAKGEHKAPGHVEKQPFGQVPYLDDDAFIVFESRAIGRYIATKYADQGTKLIPSDLKEQALFEQAASIEASNFDPYASGAVFEKLIKVRKGLQTDEVVLKRHVDTLDTKLDGYEKILSKTKYLAGDEITLVDLFHIPYGSRLREIGAGDLIEKRPHLKRWWDDISSRPSWQKVLQATKH